VTSNDSGEVIVTLRTTASLLIAVCLTATGAPAQVPAADRSVELELEVDALPREIDSFEGEIRGLWRDGRVYIGGQPDEAALGRFKALGVTTVVNLRPPSEMDNRERVPFDEAAAVGALGMEYVQIPLGGDDHPYTPAAVDRFASVLARHRGPVLLHCTVGWRASHMWSAYLVREQGFTLDQALARGKAMALSNPPIEGLLGQPLKLVFAN
jgi:uncharacterized protein (TIGR01244 family)